MQDDTITIPFNNPFIVGKELDNITQAVLGGHLSGDGKFTGLCHEWLEKRLQCRKAMLTHSGTAALEMAAILCRINPGDEVIMPSFTFVSTANAFVLRGGVPVFIDIRKDTLNLDENMIERAVTDRTRAIVPVHYAGVACAMDEILEIAGRYGLFVIEDAAQALLSDYKGKCLGTMGHFGCLSFHETKNIISGEGGALLVNSGEFIGRAEIVRDKGSDRARFFRGEIDKYTWVDIGSSYLPSELISAFLYAQMEQADQIVSKRRMLFERYYSLLGDLEAKGVIRLPFVEKGCASNGHVFYIIVRTCDERSRLISFLKDNGIMAVFHYVPLHSSEAGMRFGRVSGTMETTDEVSERLLRLPMYYDMNTGHVDFVAEKIHEFFKNV